MGKIEYCENVKFAGKTFSISYYSRHSRRNGKRFFALITFLNEDQVIIDDESLFALRASANILCPLLVEARLIYRDSRRPLQ